jgi:hypothetical protein
VAAACLSGKPDVWEVRRLQANTAGSSIRKSDRKAEESADQSEEEGATYTTQGKDPRTTVLRSNSFFFLLYYARIGNISPRINNITAIIIIGTPINAPTTVTVKIIPIMPNMIEISISESLMDKKAVIYF